MSGEDGSDGQAEDRLTKTIVVTFAFGVPLAVLQYFFVERHPWLYVPYVILLVTFIVCTRRMGWWKNEP